MALAKILNAYDIHRRARMIKPIRPRVKIQSNQGGREHGFHTQPARHPMGDEYTEERREALMSVLATIAQIAAIAAAVGAAFSFAVLRPLNASIKALQKAIDEMRAEMKESGKQRQKLEVHLAEVDQSVRSAHHRIDALEGRAHG